MTKKYDILKVRDKSDGYYTKMDRVFDLPMRVLINGPSQRSGKTTVVLNLLLRNEFYMKQFKGDNIYVISNNRLDNKLKILAEVKDIPEGNTFAYDEDKLEVLYEMLEEDFEERVADGKKPEPICMVFDDVAYSGDLKNKAAGIISKILLNGRHVNISSIFTTQKFSLVSTAVRTNVTGAILFSTTQKEVELQADDFNFLPKKQDYINMFREVTKEKNSFMVVNLTNPAETMYLDSKFEAVLPLP